MKKFFILIIVLTTLSVSSCTKMASEKGQIKVELGTKKYKFDKTSAESYSDGFILNAANGSDCIIELYFDDDGTNGDVEDFIILVNGVSWEATYNPNNPYKDEFTNIGNRINGISEGTAIDQDTQTERTITIEVIDFSTQ